MGYQVEKSDAEWREQLSPAEYQVLRQAGTERAFTGEYTDTKTVGVYKCRACSTELFRSETKFDSHCGWPSFYAPLAGDTVEYIEDRSFGSVRPDRPALLHQLDQPDARAGERRDGLRPQLAPATYHVPPTRCSAIVWSPPSVGCW